MSLLTAAADRHARVRSALERHHANAVAVYQGGEPFGVLLGREGIEPFGGQAVNTAALTASFSLAHAPGLVEGGELVLGGVVHLVSGPVQPDESGWVTVPVYPKA
jgi:hypothetical protein